MCLDVSFFFLQLLALVLTEYQLNCVARLYNDNAAVNSFQTAATRIKLLNAKHVQTIGFHHGYSQQHNHIILAQCRVVQRAHALRFHVLAVTHVKQFYSA